MYFAMIQPAIILNQAFETQIADSSPAFNPDDPASDTQTETPVRPLQIIQNGNVLQFVADERADLSKSALQINGKSSGFSAVTLDGEGRYVISYEIADAFGKCLESNEQVIVADESAPVIELSCGLSDVLTVEESYTISWFVSDLNLLYTQVILDGQEIENTGSLNLTRTNSELLIRAADQFGHLCERRLSIRPSLRLLQAPYVLNRQAFFEIEGDSSGLDLVITTENESLHHPVREGINIVDLPVEQGSIQLFKDGNTFSDRLAFDTRPEPETKDEPVSPEIKPEPVTPEEFEESRKPQQPQFPMVEKPSIPENVMAVVTPEPVPTVSILPAAKPKLALYCNGTLLKDDQMPFVSEFDRLEVKVEDGSLKALSYYLESENRTCTSIKEAIQAAGQKPVEVIARAEGTDGKSVESSWMVQGLQPLDLSLEQDGALVTTRIEQKEGTLMVENGRIYLPSVSLFAHDQPLEQVQLKPGDEIRLYIPDNQPGLTILHNNEVISNEEKRTDESGLSYIPLTAARGTNEISVRDLYGGLIHQEEKETESVQPGAKTILAWSMSGLLAGLLCSLKKRHA